MTIYLTINVHFGSHHRLKTKESSINQIGLAALFPNYLLSYLSTNAVKHATIAVSALLRLYPDSFDAVEA
jgi:hypothetical protein